jgi:leucyl-tRNA synthetase
VIWDEEGIAGVERFLQRVWRLCQRTWDASQRDSNGEGGLRRATHKTVRCVTEDIEAFKFNTAIAAMMEFATTLRGYQERRATTQVDTSPEERPHAPDGDPAGQAAVDTLMRLLAPFAPHIAEELWARRGGPFSAHQQAWPAYDPALTVDETITLVIQVNGKVRDRLVVPASISDEEARERALLSQQVQRYLNGRAPETIILVPGRLVNIVV